MKIIIILISCLFMNTAFCSNHLGGHRSIQEIKKDILTTIGEKQNTEEGKNSFNNLMNEADAAGMPDYMFKVLESRGSRVGFTYTKQEIALDEEEVRMVEKESVAEEERQALKELISKFILDVKESNVSAAEDKLAELKSNAWNENEKKDTLISSWDFTANQLKDFVLKAQSDHFKLAITIVDALEFQLDPLQRQPIEDFANDLLDELIKPSSYKVVGDAKDDQDKLFDKLNPQKGNADLQGKIDDVYRVYLKEEFKALSQKEGDLEDTDFIDFLRIFGKYDDKAIFKGILEESHEDAESIRHSVMEGLNKVRGPGYLKLIKYYKIVSVQAGVELDNSPGGFLYTFLNELRQERYQNEVKNADEDDYNSLINFVVEEAGFEREKPPLNFLLGIRPVESFSSTVLNRPSRWYKRLFEGGYQVLAFRNK